MHIHCKTLRFLFLWIVISHCSFFSAIDSGTGQALLAWAMCKAHQSTVNWIRTHRFESESSTTQRALTELDTLLSLCSSKLLAWCVLFQMWMIVRWRILADVVISLSVCYSFSVCTIASGAHYTIPFALNLTWAILHLVHTVSLLWFTVPKPI